VIEVEIDYRISGKDPIRGDMCRRVASSGRHLTPCGDV
jgi:hypothetical protein